eukprot:Gb_18024 [translate_table: standard]
MENVPRDGHTMGKVMVRSMSIMKVYFKDLHNGNWAFADSWFHISNIDIIYLNDYTEIKDRFKDIIIYSGGKNINSVEVEAILYYHSQSVMKAVVVAMSHLHWGEMPCAFLSM